MTNETNELIWRVLDGKASVDELRVLKRWMEEAECNQTYFRQCKKIWNMTNGPKLSSTRKLKEKERFLNSMRNAYGRRVEKKRIWHYWSVAASVILLIGVLVGRNLMKEENSGGPVPLVQTERIVPGVKAELILSTGEKVSLAQKSELIGGLNETGIRNDSLTGLHYAAADVQGKDRGTKIVYNTMRVPVGGFYQVTLSDGTSVWLNSMTELRYPVVFTGEQRRVYLKGEAYFDVAHDAGHPFIVATDKGMEVKVYGTEFNVNTYREGGVQTVLVDGKVGIRVEATGKEVVMKPNQMADFKRVDQSVEVKDVDPYAYIAWKNGEFVFERETIEEIMVRLGRWYDVKVFYTNEDLKQKRFTGVIDRYDDIERVLRLIEGPATLRFEVSGNVVTVRSSE